MYDDAIDPYDVGMRELSRRLEAFADTRLNPSLSGTSRMRTTVMNAAHRRAALITADRASDIAAATTTAVAGLAAERSRFTMSAWRRPMAALAAGALMLALVGGTASAASAGGPLYAARIWIEMANLPAGALARVDAEITRLDARLREAQLAYSNGDGPAAEAALAAYSVILTEAVGGSAADATASGAIESNLVRHVAVLTALVDSVPAAAQEAIRHALASSTIVLRDLDGAILRAGGRPADDGLSGPAGPGGPMPPTVPTGPTVPTEGKPIPPTKTDGIVPTPSERPQKSTTPDKDTHTQETASTPPSQVVPKGSSHPDPTARPHGKSTGPKSEGS